MLTECIAVSGRVTQSLLFAVLGAMLVVLIRWLARRNALTMRLVIGWGVIAVALIGAGPFTSLLESPASQLGITPTGLLLGLSTTVLLFIALQLSVGVSEQKARSQDLAEAVALRTAPQLDGPTSAAFSGNGVLVVIPALNEEAAVGDVVKRVRNLGWPCVVIDDGSRDRTADVATEAGALVLSLPFNVGVGAALRTGFRFAVASGFTTVVQCDGDGQHHPEQIRALVDATAAGAAADNTGAQLVVGSRFLPSSRYGGDPGRVRRGAMRALARSASRAARTSITDPTSGFRAVHEPLLSAFARSYPTHYLGDTYEALVAAGRAGYRVAEVPVDMSQRQSGAPSSGRGRSANLVARALLAVVLRISPPIDRADSAP